MEENKVELYGMWASPFAKRVEVALKIKGIPYEWVEQDLKNKSDLLIKYNPIHRKVPVLIHNGKPISESLVMLEYIDETWTNSPRFMPNDPYKRSKLRFWANFIDQQLVENFRKVLKLSGEEQGKVLEDLHRNLKVLEDNMGDIFSGNSSSIVAENMGFLDIVMCTRSSVNAVIEEAANVNLIDQEKYPLLQTWIAALGDHEAVKETVPPHAKLLEYFQHARLVALQSHQD